MESNWMACIRPDERPEYVINQLLKLIPFDPDRIQQTEILRLVPFSKTTVYNYLNMLAEKKIIKRKEEYSKTRKKKPHVYYSKSIEVNIEQLLKEMHDKIFDTSEEVRTQTLNYEQKSKIEYASMIQESFQTLFDIYTNLLSTPSKMNQNEVPFIILSKHRMLPELRHVDFPYYEGKDISELWLQSLIDMMDVGQIIEIEDGKYLVYKKEPNSLEIIPLSYLSDTLISELIDAGRTTNIQIAFNWVSFWMRHTFGLQVQL